MSNDVKMFLCLIAGIALGVISMLGFHADNPPEYTVDWKDVGRIKSTWHDGILYRIVTEKDEFGGIDFHAEEKLKKFTVGKNLLKLYVVKQLKFPGMKSDDIGQVDIRYSCRGCGEFIDGGTMVTGSIKW